ncbi:iron-binding protein [Coemansia sp. RSA 2706]|nr:iron-binding protein [Coemansia sp. RSA 2706]KAJ2311928.1 iron-binding protein [Coemansia sp. RSA 2705]KAJ2317849.1 iron-binding protein [Coemansia sp. RSA 2704]KAJ2326597.1 iron-binding protein [Coemansia sp. RSA 2702]KAJ2730311.1 iron-binding protein [Coemansia sp. Cherry 401B]
MFSLARQLAGATMRQAPSAMRAGAAVPASAFAARRFYHEKVIDHYERPRNVGSLDKNDPTVGTGLVGAPACGDVMRLQIKVDDKGNISDVKFKTFGCGSAIASSSYITERVRGMNIDEALKIKNTDIAKELCLPPVKLHCSMLAEDAIKSAIKDFRKKRGGDVIHGEGAKPVSATA